MEVVIETDEPGMIVDPTEEEHDETEDLLKNIQRIYYINQYFEL